jgi:hypothetical protein
MSDELERLRDVARAAAAFLEADDEYAGRLNELMESDPTAPGGVTGPEVDQLAEVFATRRTELAEALARL